MTTAYFLQSTKKPDSKLLPSSKKGYMILVDEIPCKYGSKCHRKCYSVAPYFEGGLVNTKNRHNKVHYHIAKDAKWQNNRSILPFKKL